VLIVWRSGQLLHLGIHSGGSIALLGLADLGPRPPVSRRLPGGGGGYRFLAVGCRSAVVSFDQEDGEMTVQWLSLPDVYHAAPMNIPSSGDRWPPPS
jgi:hypothetical protein